MRTASNSTALHRPAPSEVAADAEPPPMKTTEEPALLERRDLDETFSSDKVEAKSLPDGLGTGRDLRCPLTFNVV